MCKDKRGARERKWKKKKKTKNNVVKFVPARRQNGERETAGDKKMLTIAAKEKARDSKQDKSEKSQKNEEERKEYILWGTNATKILGGQIKGKQTPNQKHNDWTRGQRSRDRSYSL